MNKVYSEITDERRRADAVEQLIDRLIWVLRMICCAALLAVIGAAIFALALLENEDLLWRG